MDNDYGEVIVGFVFGMGYHVFYLVGYSLVLITFYLWIPYF